MNALSIVAVPKPFVGHIGTIQTNAIRSWKALSNHGEILLLGDEPGTAEVAKSVGARHLPDLDLDEYGTPLVDDVFRVAEASAISDWLCYVNCDVILLPEFFKAARAAISSLGSSLIVSRRINLDLNQLIDVKDGWAANIRERAEREGTLFSRFGIDVFVFKKGTYGSIPKFSLGRFSWDNWLVHHVREKGLPVVDVTDASGVVHQTHGYEGYASPDELRRSPQALRNFWLAGDSLHGFSSTADATHVLKGEDIVQAPTKTVSVVIPHAGSLGQLCGCLRAFVYQSYPRSYIEVIVVENSEQSLSAAVLLEFPFVKLTREAKPGPAAARNKGAALASGDVLAFLDSDCWAAGDWIEMAIDRAQQYNFNCVVACNVSPGLSGKGSLGVKFYEAVTFHEQHAYVEHSHACITGGMVVPRSVWRKVGPFNESFDEAACEDWEWSTRASGLGVPVVYAAAAVVTHPVHTTWKQLTSKAKRLARGEIRLARMRGDVRLLSFRGVLSSYWHRLRHDLRKATHDPRIPAAARIPVAGSAVWIAMISVWESRKLIKVTE